MHKVVKLLFITILTFTIGCNSKTKACPLDERYVDEITETFVKEMEKKYGLLCCSSGASMPYEIQEVIISFKILKKPTLDEVREYEVRAIERLLELINSHEKIRPYLAEYPFTSERVDVSISFGDKYGQVHTDGNITIVSFIHNQLFFRRAEKITRTRGPFYDSEGKIMEPINETYETIKIITILKEPYEEALEKVKNYQTSLIDQIPPKKTEKSAFMKQISEKIKELNEEYGFYRGEKHAQSR